MAIHSKANPPTITTTRWVTAAEGTIDFGQVEINTHALDYPFPVSYNTIEDPEGSSFIIDEDPPAGIVLGDVNGLHDGFQATDIDPAANVVIWAGAGKVKFFDKATAAATDFNEVTKELSQMQLPVFVNGFNIEMLQGSFAFASSALSSAADQVGATGTGDPYRVGADVSTVLIDGAVANTAGDTVRGGQGKAVLTAAGGFSKVINLTTVSYPFELIGGESISPIGSSVVFVEEA